VHPRLRAGDHRRAVAPGRLPALQRRLSHRNPWIDALSLLHAGRAEAREPLLATITGIAAGMRDTG
jgi:phosphoenolpyruvate carboxylase